MKSLLLLAGLIFIGITGYLAFYNLITKDSIFTQNFSRNSATAFNGLPLKDHIKVVPIMHATFVLEWAKEIILFDPVDIDMIKDIKPTFIFITDVHGDHFNVDVLEEIVRQETILIVPQSVADLLPATLLQNTVIVNNGSSTIQNSITIEAVPMYNLPESIDRRHVKERGNGYLLERDGIRIYIAGDTDDIKEMRSLNKIDIAFIPMNPPYTMSVEEAAGIVLDFAPRQVYPYHYRTDNGLSDVKRFKGLVTVGNPDIKVILGNWY